MNGDTSEGHQEAETVDAEVRANLRRHMLSRGVEEGDVSSEVQSVLLVDRQKRAARRGRLLAWLRGIANYKLKEYWRRKSKRRGHTLAEAGGLDDAPGPATQASAQEATQATIEAMEGLDPVTREILSLWTMDLTYAQIGSRFSMTEDAVRMRVKRALEKLKLKLGGC